MMKRTFAALLAIASTQLIAAQETITYQEAFGQVFEQSYDIKAAEENVEARKGDTWQAGRIPNPILTVEGQELGGAGGPCSDQDELFVGIVQAFELGGKRNARERFAEAIEVGSYWDLEITKTETENAFLHAFVAAAAAQERLALASRQAGFSKEVVTNVQRKVEAGKASALDMRRAEIAYNSAAISISQQQFAFRQEMVKLKAFWTTPPCFTDLNFPLYELQAPPSFCSLTEGVETNPVLGKAQASTTAACRRLELARSERFPTIAIQVGVTTERYINGPTATVGIDIPIQIFDRNSGNIESAMHDHYQAIYEQESAKVQLKTALEVTYHEWLMAYDQAMRLKAEILPRAEETHEFSKQGYLEGKFNYLEYLDAQKMLVDAQQQYLDAVEQYHHKRADVLKLAKSCTVTN